MIYYKAIFCPEEEGLVVRFDSWRPIHESDCYHYCIPEFAMPKFQLRLAVVNKQAGTPLKIAKDAGINTKRISRVSSRFAYPSKEIALDRLLSLKARQFRHLQREIAFLTRFLEVKEADNPMDALVPYQHETLMVPNTKELVAEYLRFY